jgi:cholesterol transport system auxiliary component
MKKLSLLLAIFLLAACAGGGRNSSVPAAYDFGMPPARLAAAVDGGWSKLALEIRSPYWFDSLNIEYRLLYEDPLKLRDYAGSRWAGAPALLLGQRLRQQLGVSSSTSNAAVDCLLRLDLQEFSQVFDSPQQSRALLHGSLSLLDGKRLLLAERVVHVEQPAATADARGGVTALVSASEALGQEMANWLTMLEKKGALANCRANTVARQ